MSLTLPDKWIWDSWYVRDGDTVHAFYLHASRALADPERRHHHPIVGHATSTDLTTWTVVADAIIVSDPGAFDDGTTWTGSVVRDDDGLWWMFYTGTMLAEGRLVQRIGAATSVDLVTWTKVSSSPLVAADARHYEVLAVPAIEGAWREECWRDPWVFRNDNSDRWQMLITGRANSGPIADRGVMALATSADLLNWVVEPPLSRPGQGFGHLEVFQFEIVDGVPIILFCCAAAELSPERIAAGEKGGVYSVVVDPTLSAIDFTRAVAFDRPELYAARLVQDKSGTWNLLGFINEVDGLFVGSLSDPIPVTAERASGLVPLVDAMLVS